MILFRGTWGTNQKLTASFVPGYLEPDQNQLWFPDPELEPKLETWIKNYFFKIQTKIRLRIPIFVESKQFIIF